MDNLRAVIKEIFCHVSYQSIREGRVKFDDFDIKTFEKLGNGYNTAYSKDELYNMYYAMENEFYWQNRKWLDVENIQQRTAFNVFDALTTFNMSVLTEEEGLPKCQYAQLLRWRDMTLELEEDLFITSYLGYLDAWNPKERSNFFWNPVIGHNNVELNKLMEEGVAENHFHLKGSSPHFHISWISMMNDVKNKDFYKYLEKYDNERQSNNITYDASYSSELLVTMWLQAVVIRLFLYSILTDNYLYLDEYYVTLADVNECLQEKEKLHQIKIQNADKERILLSEILEANNELSAATIKKLKQCASGHWVDDCLKNVNVLRDCTGLLQRNICRFREEYNLSMYDYCLYKPELISNQNKGVNEVISGERHFMYSIFKRIYKKDKKDLLYTYGNWFYLYLVIKANIRNELVQANQGVGFKNFSDYQDRKEHFIENTVYEKIYLKMAVRDTIYNQHITSLEARIAPKNSLEDLEKAIKKYDAAILDGISDDKQKEQLLSKYFYVVHFIKEHEHYQSKTDKITEKQCRHKESRDKIKVQAKTIAALREKRTKEAARIHGIDASASELWCRPEVFAQAFRYLKNHTVYDDANILDKVKCQQLMSTFHVGEDFFDIIDGLRAIDEAINFLGLKCGDRLGHALALGVDIDDWYKGKSNHIIINKQGYLDNLVWLYSKIREYRIDGCSVVLEYIMKRFEQYFNEVYRNNISDEEIQKIICDAREYYGKRQMEHNFNYVNMNLGINQYYDSWKLRGDNPELYKNGYPKFDGLNLDEWNRYALNKEFPDNYRLRYQPEVAILYHMYHYNDRVKAEGDMMIEVVVNDLVKDAIKKVRFEMQKQIRNLGIGIETNPSSNYLIGTFRRYDKHPIIQWYNEGLVNDAQLLGNCAQLSVSINTDDQGVFSTYIENEYAYLALALEKYKDSNENIIYNRTMIMKWLDNIRKMGIGQAFTWRESS